MKLIEQNNPILYTISEEVAPKDLFNIYETSEEMVQLMKKNRGCGLAANQVGITKRFFIITLNSGEILTCVNPSMTNHGKDIIESSEGCLSFPYVNKTVNRWKIIDITYMILPNIMTKRTLKGKESIIFQHELDHLNGKCIEEQKT